MASRFLINCDDLGMHATVNEGICDLLAGGLVCSASLMAPGQAFEDAIRRLRCIGLDHCGVHLTLNSEYPRLPTQPVLGGAVDSLCDADGRLLADPLDSRKQADIEQVRREFQAQMKKIENAGIHLTHIDGHMFCYDPAKGGEDIARVVREIAETAGLPIRHLNPDGTGPGFKTQIIWEGYDDQATRFEFYRKILVGTSESVEEIIIHPAKNLEQVARFSNAGERRLGDYRFFSSQGFSDLVIANKLEIMGWPEALELYAAIR
jgi:predicted glycoside hydrolase/deacetylase ChbG (UPF0249 family)